MSSGLEGTALGLIRQSAGWLRAALGRTVWIVYLDTLIVFTCSVVWITIENRPAYEIGYIAAFPSAAIVAAILYVGFILAGFDPTDGAPLWQDILTRIGLVVGLTAAAFIHTSVIAFGSKAICRELRRRTRFRQEDGLSVQEVTFIARTFERWRRSCRSLFFRRWPETS